jgi:hypothetical protein
MAGQKINGGVHFPLGRVGAIVNEEAHQRISTTTFPGLHGSAK